MRQRKITKGEIERKSLIVERIERIYLVKFKLNTASGH